MLLDGIYFLPVAIPVDRRCFYAASRNKALTECGTQRTLRDFGQDADAGTDDRPVADEAAAIAGNGGSDDGDTSVVDLDERQFPPVEETVEFVVTQVDYTIEGQGDDESPVVHVFGRTDDNETDHARVLGFEPYFYAPTDTLDDDSASTTASPAGK